jgi:hypothetical protein
MMAKLPMINHEIWERIFRETHIEHQRGFFKAPTLPKKIRQSNDKQREN